MDYAREATMFVANKNTTVPGERLPWFSPTVGTHKVKFLTDGEEYERTFQNEKSQAVRFEVEVNDRRSNWGVGKAKSEASLWGQVVLLGRKHGNLAGKTFTVVVKSMQNRMGRQVRNYTILEALELMGQSSGRLAAPAASAEPQTLNEKLAALKASGFVGMRDELASKLGVPNEQIDLLANLGSVEKKGDFYKVK